MAIYRFPSRYTEVVQKLIRPCLFNKVANIRDIISFFGDLDAVFVSYIVTRS